MPAAAFRAAMNVDVFAEDIVRTDRQKRVFAFEFQILRLKADRSEGKKLIVVADRRRPLDDHVRFEAAAVPDLDTRSPIRQNGPMCTSLTDFASGLTIARRDESRLLTYGRKQRGLSREFRADVNFALHFPDDRLAPNALRRRCASDRRERSAGETSLRRCP